MNPESTGTVTRLREHLAQLRTAVRTARELHDATAEERDTAVRERWSLQKQIAAGKRATEAFDTMQDAQDAAKAREKALREGLREVLKDLTALSRYLRP